MRTLGRDLPEKPVGIPIDSRSVLGRVDEQVVERARAAVRALDRLEARLPAVVHVMRDSMAGQPRAAASHREGDDGDADGDRARARLWCATHERSMAQCEATDLDCSIDRDRQISDPTGVAAVGHDQAAVDLGHLRHLLGQLTATTVRLVALAEAYPTEAVERQQLSGDDEVGTVYCVCCYKDDRRLELITVRASGQRAGKKYYRDRCKWCGERTELLGFDPPKWMVAAHHRGERITAGMMQKAMAERPASSAAKGKKGKRRK